MISPKPKKKAAKTTKPTKEVAAQKFIKGGTESANGTNGTLQPVMMKIDRTTLAVIDEKAKSMGLTRTAFMITSATLKAGELHSKHAQADFIIAAHRAKS
jgi:uncharacterized protein (DUF1778 family)